MSYGNHVPQLSISTVLFISGLFFYMAQPAYAYIDPGTGSQVIQVGIAVFFGALFFIKELWQKLRFFRQKHDPQTITSHKPKEK